MVQQSVLDCPMHEIFRPCQYNSVSDTAEIIVARTVLRKHIVAQCPVACRQAVIPDSEFLSCTWKVYDVLCRIERRLTAVIRNGNNSCLIITAIRHTEYVLHASVRSHDCIALKPSCRTYGIVSVLKLVAEGPRIGIQKVGTCIRREHQRCKRPPSPICVTLVLHGFPYTSIVEHDWGWRRMIITCLEKSRLAIDRLCPCASSVVRSKDDNVAVSHHTSRLNSYHIKLAFVCKQLSPVKRIYLADLSPRLSLVDRLVYIGIRDYSAEDVVRSQISSVIKYRYARRTDILLGRSLGIEDYHSWRRQYIYNGFIRNVCRNHKYTCPAVCCNFNNTAFFYIF